MIYTTIDNGSQLQDEFKKFSDRGNTFTPAGYDALFDYLDNGRNVELDVIDLCCTWSEYESADAAASEYSWTLDDGDALAWLNKRTKTMATRSGSIIIKNF